MNLNKKPVPVRYWFTGISPRAKETYRYLRAIGLTRNDANMAMIGWLLSAGEFSCVGVRRPPAKEAA